jgi:hypothetical protein
MHSGGEESVQVDMEMLGALVKLKNEFSVYHSVAVSNVLRIYVFKCK